MRFPRLSSFTKAGLLRRSQYLVIGLGLVPLLLAVFAYQTSTQHVNSVQAMLNTDLLIRSLDELFSTVQDAETGQRGYVLTGDVQYLRPFEAAKEAIGRELARLKAAPQSSKRQAAELPALENLVLQKMEELQKTIALRRDVGFDSALAEVRTNRGQEYMRRIRSIVGRLKQQETKTLAERAEYERRSQLHLESVMAIGVAIAFLLLVLSYRFSVLYARERENAEITARDLATALEVRVKERTAELETRTRELEDRTRELARSNADLLSFAYIASHDLQEPLRMVGSYMGLLARRYQDKFDENAQKYMQFAIDGANRMQALIQDLLAYSRAGTQALKRKPVALSDVLEIVRNNLSISIKETCSTVRAGTLPVVFADESKLTQVVQNLIGNGIKFRKPDVSPQIEVSARRESSEWVFQVSDNGIGFDPRYSERIFQVFQRLHGVGKYPGNGIGLAICRRIIEHHGGRLWAESEPGRGSSFFFSLPIATDKPTLESDEVARTAYNPAEPVTHASP